MQADRKRTTVRSVGPFRGFGEGVHVMSQKDEKTTVAHSAPSVLHWSCPANPEFQGLMALPLHSRIKSLSDACVVEMHVC